MKWLIFVIALSCLACGEARTGEGMGGEGGASENAIGKAASGGAASVGSTAVDCRVSQVGKVGSQCATVPRGVWFTTEPSNILENGCALNLHVSNNDLELSKSGIAWVRVSDTDLVIWRDCDTAVELEVQPKDCRVTKIDVSSQCATIPSGVSWTTYPESIQSNGCSADLSPTTIDLELSKNSVDTWILISDTVHLVWRDCDQESENPDDVVDFECPNGYNNDPSNTLNCINIDECKLGIDNCYPLATCLDTEGKFTCTCPNGYAGDGTSCVLG